MAMNTTIDNGGEDQYPEKGPLDNAHPTFEQHEQVMGEMLPDVPEQPVEELQASHEATLAEMVGPQLSLPRPSLLEEVQAVTSEPEQFPEKPQKGRVYFPPQERTRANREQRRAAVQQARAAESPNLSGFFESGGQLPDFAEGQNENPQVALMEAGYRLSESLTHAVVDLTRRVNMLTEALERARL